MEAGLLVGGGEESRLRTGVGGEGGRELELDTLGDLVVNLDLGLEDVARRPGLGERQAVGLVEELGLDVAADEGRLCVAVAANLEGHVRGRDGLHLESDTVQWVVLAQEVIGGLAEILWKIRSSVLY